MSGSPHTRTMAPFRVIFIVAIITLSSRGTFALVSTISSIKATHRVTPPTHLAASGTEDLPTTNSASQKQDSKYPRAAVSIALRCFCGDPEDPKPHYLLIRRGNEPNKGKWALPGGKLEWGERTLTGAKRELSEEVIFESLDEFESKESSYEISWCPEPFAVADAIAEGFHYLIAVCFAECKPTNGGGSLLEPPPEVIASDDAIDARWWSMDEVLNMEDNDLVGTPGFVRRLKRTELLYQQGILTSDEFVEI